MFFLVAGYFSKAHIDSSSDRKNIKNYISRLFPAFAFTQLLICIWCALMAYVGKGIWSEAISMFLSLLWADPLGPHTPWGRLSIGVIWFLFALLVAKLILIPLSRTGKWAIPISLALAYGVILLNRAWPYSIFCISHGLTALPFVTIGWWVKNHSVPTWLIISSVIAWIVALCFSHLVMYDIDWGCYPLDVLAACGGTYCLYIISKGITKYAKPCGKILAILGIWSLAIMCAHCFEMAAHLGNHIMGLTPFDYPVWAKYIVRYTVTIVLAILFYYLPGTKKIFS